MAIKVGGSHWVGCEDQVRQEFLPTFDNLQTAVNIQEPRVIVVLVRSVILLPNHETSPKGYDKPSCVVEALLAIVKFDPRRVTHCLELAGLFCQLLIGMLAFFN